MKPTGAEVIEAVIADNIDLLQELEKGDINFNEVEEDGSTLFEEILFWLEHDDKPYKYSIVKTLIKLGADPKICGPESGGPLVSPMLKMDTEMLKILFEAGADPNVNGFTENELIYDWAEFDYRYQVLGINPPDEPTEEDEKNEDTWLNYLDRTAVKHNDRRPDYLFVFRKYGARSIKELVNNNKNEI